MYSNKDNLEYKNMPRAAGRRVRAYLSISKVVDNLTTCVMYRKKREPTTKVQSKRIPSLMMKTPKWSLSVSIHF